MKWLMLGLVLLAQTPVPVPTFVTVNVTRPTTTFSRTFIWAWEPAIYCNLEPRVPLKGILYNPSTIEFPDPTDPLKACRINWEPFLVTLPPANNYHLDVGYLYAVGPPSTRSPLSGVFQRGPIGSLCVDRGGAEAVQSSVTTSGEVIRLWACAEAQ